MSLSAEQLQELADELASHHARWEDLIVPDARSRVYRLVWDDPVANAWLIGWCHDQDTGWHDHDDAAAAITVLSGRVRELRMRMSGEPAARLLGPGASFHVPASAIHRVQHAGHTPAVTLHCYSPPLRRTGAYSFGPAGELQRSAQSLEQELRAEPALF